MTTPTDRDCRYTGNFISNGKLIAIFAAAVLYTVAALLFLHSNFGLDVADEGFFWHGAQQVHMGFAPHRDFRSYEPARYYWTALVYKWLGTTSNYATRLSCAAFGGVVYTAAAALAIDWKKSGKVAGIASLFAILTSLCIWTFPYYRVFDTGAAALTLTSCIVLLRSNSIRDVTACGVMSGVVFTLGRNHGLYAFVSLGICILAEALQKREWKRLVGIKAQVLTGAMLTTIVLLFLIQEIFKTGSAAASVRAWIELFRRGTTNVATDWPWQQIDAGMSASHLEGHLVTGLTVLIVFSVGIGGCISIFIRAWKQMDTPLIWTATSATTLGYLHCTTSRPDLIHIGTTFIPVVLGILAWCAGTGSRYRVTSLLAIGYISARSALREQTSYQCLTKPDRCQQVAVSPSETISSKEDPAETFAYISQAVGDETFLAIPAYATLYAAKKRIAPGWAFYEVWPADKQTQLNRIAEISWMGPKTIVVKSSGDRLDPESTMPLVVDYIRARYVQTEMNERLGIAIFRIKAPTEQAQNTLKAQRKRHI